MIGKAMSFVSSSVLWLGFFFVLYGVGIVLKSDSRRYLRDSELLKIVTELTATWRTKTRGFVRASWVAVVCTFAVLAFISVPLKHSLFPAETVVGHWWYFPHIPDIMPDNEYIVLHMDREDKLYGSESRYVFCAKGEKIAFDEGEMLTEIVYKEHGDCKELVNYNFQKEDHDRRLVKKYKTNDEVMR